MKQNVKILTILLAITVMLGLFPAVCFASYRVEPLKTNQWYSLKDSSNNMTIYRVKVSVDTALIIEWKRYITDDNFAYGTISTDKACSNDITSFMGVSVPSTGTKGIVLYPGTYYIKMYDGKEKAQVRITKKTVKSINKQNYCARKAINLSKKKKVQFAQSKKDNYTRWYKIKITKNQSFSIYGYDGWYNLYDSNFNEIRCREDYDTSVITTDGIQPKGTYYLALYDYVSSLLTTGKCYSIYWK